MKRPTPDTDELLVQTESGVVRGTVASGVRSWRGIPYAAPPVGDRRFRAPQRASSWQGTRDASRFGALPMQKRGFEVIGGAGQKTPMSEDCLTINVSAPISKGTGLRPVIVWIYGGGFTLGGTRSALYRGDRVVTAGDVVFVSFNYRLGIFGFADFSSWSVSEHLIESNLGLRDQVAALQWVKRNIAGFGGDPDNVTIAGESAGATSAIALMCIPAAAGLFHRVFALSASGTVYGPQRHRLWAGALLGMLGIDPAERELVARSLKELSAERLTAAASRFFYEIAPDAYPGLLPSSPVIDGDFLPQSPVDAFQDGSAQRLPLVIGTMSREGAILDKALPVICSRVNRLEAMLKEADPELRTRVARAYIGYPSKRTAVDIAGDLTFWLPSVRIAEGHSRFSPCWSYRFDYATPFTRLLFREATHGLDLPMLFGTTGEGALGRFDYFSRSASKEMSRRFQRVFLDFAHGRLPEWSTYEDGARLTRIFDKEDRDECDPRGERRLAFGSYGGPE
ncbi:carboxylesterase [Burkholderia cepacia]|uniref:carboxylesterase/lipase family protein n=1 Tax=Burkholderia cepacia complex TaxID=87882 RepID=UPI00075FF62F|nr:MULTISPECIES: carboxylesterase/lipase family protein [Burkholderia cepacia complex]KWE18336.1 carboxylesterase [Burkholderia cepacia]KWK42838.1 carboxylesterase [Burkholderia stagnalis]KWK48197.1 carboxylesterase [Burkholderia stagnalis]